MRMATGMPDKTVCGHMCEGLQTFQDAADYQCMPRLDDDGRVAGCDDTNPVPLRYCPFCALSLRCPGCGEPNGHNYRPCCVALTCQPHEADCEAVR